MDEPDFYANFLEANMRALRREIQKAKSMTKGILGVNIMVAMSNFGDLVRTSIEEKIDVIFSSCRWTYLNILPKDVGPNWFPSSHPVGQPV